MRKTGKLEDEVVIVMGLDKFEARLSVLEQKAICAERGHQWGVLGVWKTFNPKEFHLLQGCKRCRFQRSRDVSVEPLESFGKAVLDWAEDDDTLAYPGSAAKR